MLEELITCFVDCWCRRIALEIAGSGDLAGEVVACVEEFEEAAYCVEILVNEVDATFLSSLLIGLNIIKLCRRKRIN